MGARRGSAIAGCAVPGDGRGSDRRRKGTVRRGGPESEQERSRGSGGGRRAAPWRLDDALVGEICEKAVFKSGVNQKSNSVQADPVESFEKIKFSKARYSTVLCCNRVKFFIIIDRLRLSSCSRWFHGSGV